MLFLCFTLSHKRGDGLFVCLQYFGVARHGKSTEINKEIESAIDQWFSTGCPLGALFDGLPIFYWFV